MSCLWPPIPTKREMCNNKTTGFSLIEIVIALSLVVILITLTFPSYRLNMIKARRHDGQLALYDLANRLEHYYSQEHSYETATMGTGTLTDVKDDDFSPGKWYRLAINTQNSNDFTLRAIPIGTQIQDQDCQTLTLDNQGNKGIASGPNGIPKAKVKKCWQE